MNNQIVQSLLARIEQLERTVERMSASAEVAPAYNQRGIGHIKSNSTSTDVPIQVKTNIDLNQSRITRLDFRGCIYEPSTLVDVQAKFMSRPNNGGEIVRFQSAGSGMSVSVYISADRPVSAELSSSLGFYLCGIVIDAMSASPSGFAMSVQLVEWSQSETRY